MSSIVVGAILEGKVTGITHFGAFVELEGGKTGLVHISEVADTYVKDVKDYLKENDVVKVKVIAVENGKIGLSIKQADPDYRPRPKPSRNRASQQSFEEKLAKFLKESEDRQADLKRSIESKRGGRGSRYSRFENF